MNNVNYMISFLENKTYSSVRTEALSVIELLFKKLEGEFLILLIGGLESQGDFMADVLGIFLFSIFIFNEAYIPKCKLVYLYMKV